MRAISTTRVWLSPVCVVGESVGGVRGGYSPCSSPASGLTWHTHCMEAHSSQWYNGCVPLCLSPDLCVAGWGVGGVRGV